MKENRKRQVQSILTAGAAAVSLLLAAGSFAQAGCIRLEQEPRSVAADVGQMADEAVQKGAAAKITLAETEETMRSAAKVQLQSREKIRQMEEERARIRAEEQELLAALIFCEAGNQPYEGQVAVGAVVMNRIRSAGPFMTNFIRCSAVCMRM